MKLVVILLLSVFISLTGCKSTETSDAIRPENAKNHLDSEVQVCGQVTSTEFASTSKNKPTFINMEKANPDHDFTIVIWGDTREILGYAPDVLLDQMEVCVTGEVELHEGKPQLVVNHPRQILIPRLQTKASMERVYGT